MYQLNNRARRPASIYALNYQPNKNVLNRCWCKAFLAAVWNIKMKKTRILPAMQETWVQFLSQEDPLEKEMETHSSILAWKMTWTEEPGGLRSIESQKSWT